MTNHELARQLLNEPECPVRLSIGNPNDSAYTSDLRVIVVREADNKLSHVRIEGWVASDDEDAYFPEC